MSLKMTETFIKYATVEQKMSFLNTNKQFKLNLIIQDWIVPSTKMRSAIGLGTRTISQKYVKVIINQDKMALFS